MLPPPICATFNNLTEPDEHVFALTQALARYDFFQAQIQACDEHIAATLETLSHDEAAAQPLRVPARGVRNARYRRHAVRLGR
jgi:hypothetical protein